MRKIIVVGGTAIVLLFLAVSAKASTIGMFFENAVPPHLLESEEVTFVLGGSETKYRNVVTRSETDPNTFIQEQYLGDTDTLLYRREFSYYPDGSYQLKETGLYGEIIFRISRASPDSVRYEQIRLGKSEVFTFWITKRDVAGRPMESETDFAGMIIRTFAERNAVGKLVSERVEWWDGTKLVDRTIWYFNDAGRVYKIVK